MNIEDDDFPDPDYGVFGDNRPLPSKTLSARDLAEVKRLIAKEEARAKASRDFNRYMIDLYNKNSR